jgi:tripartite-type tricarboxylate transporter receptor subunit TctC
MAAGILLAVLSIAAFFASAPAHGQAGSDKTVKVQVPFAPGGGTDILARILAPRVGERLGQPVVVENRPGASGAIAARYTAQATPDGLTVMLGTISEIAINPSLSPKLGYDVWRDFALIGPIAYTPMTVVVHPSVPAKNVKELIALATQRPGQLNYGSAGTGSGAHMAAELFRYLTKVDITHVPYKGTGAAVADLVGGQVQMVFTTVPSAVNFVRNGQLMALGVASAQRAPQMPEVPTFVEAGVPEYLMDYWYCLVAPAATPKEIQARLNTAFRDALRLPEVVASLDKAGLLPMSAGQDEFAAFVKKETERWAAVVKAAGIKVE